MEVQLIGIMAPIYLIAHESSRMIQTRRYHLEFDSVVKMALGGVLGLAIYYILTFCRSWRPRRTLPDGGGITRSISYMGISCYALGSFADQHVVGSRRDAGGDAE
jgi:hypothetical protein